MAKAMAMWQVCKTSWREDFMNGDEDPANHG
jgi:hypothetical protein